MVNAFHEASMFVRFVLFVTLRVAFFGLTWVMLWLLPESEQETTHD